MAGPIQKALSDVVSIASGATVAGKKLKDNERQASEEASAKAEAQAKAEADAKKKAEDIAKKEAQAKADREAKEAQAKADREAKEAQAKADREAQAKAKSEATMKEAQSVALQADLIRMGADPKSAEAFVNAKDLGLDTKGFGMIRKQGKFVGSYSSLADKLSKDALTDSLSSRVINQKGFAERIATLSQSRKGRVEALVKASEGGNNNVKK